MKALIYKGLKNLSLEEVHLPKLQTGWIRIKVEAAGLCGSDIQKIFFSRPPSDYLKTNILGHEISGTVVEIGSGVKRFKEGDRVAIEPLISCLDCEFCNSGKSQLCRSLQSIGRDLPGGFAEYTQAPEENVWLLPENISFEEASQIDLVAVAVHAIDLADIERVDKKIAVIGDGPLAIITAQAAQSSGAGFVTLFAKHERKAEIARQVNIQNVVVNVSEQELLDFRESFDLIFEVVGGIQSESFNQSVEMINRGGTLIVLGVFDFNYSASIVLRNLFYKEIKLVGCNSYSKTFRKGDFSRALEQIKRGVINTKSIVTHCIPFDNYQEAFELIEHKDKSAVIKIVFQP